MMHDPYAEGYTKYRCDWTRSGPPLPLEALQALMAGRERLYVAGLIGHDTAQKVGFGNISQRHPFLPDQFVISGTQTGHLSPLGLDHFSLVTRTDIDRNQLWCEGPVQASSESLTHAAVYTLLPAYQAVAHVHSRALWERYYDTWPLTHPEVPYGSPEMAAEVARLFQESDLPTRRCLVMGGHQDGLLSFGETVDEAVDRLLSLQAG